MYEKPTFLLPKKVVATVTVDEIQMMVRFCHKLEEIDDPPFFDSRRYEYHILALLGLGSLNLVYEIAHIRATKAIIFWFVYTRDHDIIDLFRDTNLYLKLLDKRRSTLAVPEGETT